MVSIRSLLAVTLAAAAARVFASPIAQHDLLDAFEVLSDWQEDGCSELLQRRAWYLRVPPSE